VLLMAHKVETRTREKEKSFFRSPTPFLQGIKQIKC
jgi:hypothetical protein